MAGQIPDDLGADGDPADTEQPDSAQSAHSDHADSGRFDSEQAASEHATTAPVVVAMKHRRTSGRTPPRRAEAGRGRHTRLLAGMAAAIVAVAGLAAALVAAGGDDTSTVADSAAAPLERTLQAAEAPTSTTVGSAIQRDQPGAGAGGSTQIPQPDSPAAASDTNSNNTALAPSVAPAAVPPRELGTFADARALVTGLEAEGTVSAAEPTSVAPASGDHAAPTTVPPPPAAGVDATTLGSAATCAPAGSSLLGEAVVDGRRLLVTIDGDDNGSRRLRAYAVETCALVIDTVLGH
jgi:hypothetical protein